MFFRNWHSPTFAISSNRVHSQCFLQIAKHTNIVNNQTIYFSRKNSICPGDRLHQGVIFHWLVQIQRRKHRYIKSRQPHTAHNHHAKWIIGIFEFLFHVLFDHSFAMRPNVNAFFFKIAHLILR